MIISKRKNFLVIDNITEQVEMFAETLEQVEKELIENSQPDSGNYYIYELKKIVKVLSEIKVVEVQEEVEKEEEAE